jgi:MFS family permease
LPTTLATPDTHDRMPALVIATIAAFLTPFTVSSVTVALPSIGADLSIDAVTLSWVATAYLLSAAVFLLPFGRLADIYGRKRIFAFGIGLYALASLLITLTPSAAALIALRVLEGMGASMMFATSIAILTSVFPPGERGKMLGIAVAATYIGLSMGPLLGGLLAHHFGWRSIFIVNIPLGIIVIGFAVLKLNGEWAEARGERFDWTGSFILAAALTAFIHGVTRLPSLLAGLSIIAGVAGLVLFMRLS